MEKENLSNAPFPILGRQQSQKLQNSSEAQNGSRARPRRVSSRIGRDEAAMESDAEFRSSSKKRKRNEFEDEDEPVADDSIPDSPSGKRRKMQDLPDSSSVPKPEGPGRKLVNKIITRTQSISHFVRNTPLKFGTMRKKGSTGKDDAAESDYLQSAPKSSSEALISSPLFLSPLKRKRGQAKEGAAPQTTPSGPQSKRDLLQHSVSAKSLPSRKQGHRSLIPARSASAFPPMISACPGWLLELGADGEISLDEIGTSTSTASSESWYSDIFLGKEHANFVGEDDKVGLVSVSMLKEDGIYKVVVRTLSGTEMISIPVDNVRAGIFSKQGLKAVLKAAIPSLHLRNIRQVKNDKHEQELKLFEANEVHFKFKWGILYCKKGQSDENEMFQNQDESPQFSEFLKLLGDRVELLGFQGYNGGLDTSRNATGEHSVHTMFGDDEIMFHVSTLMPYTDGCEQQLERKRHIGNDIVVIVFQDGCGDVYKPSTITTHFQHVLAVVQVEQGTGIDGVPARYRVQFARKEGVPEFGPVLPAPAVFESGKDFRDFFIQKLLNGERAAMKAPAFERAISRTRSGFLQLYHSQYPKSN